MKKLPNRFLTNVLHFCHQLATRMFFTPREIFFTRFSPRFSPRCSPRFVTPLFTLFFTSFSYHFSLTFSLDSPLGEGLPQAVCQRLGQASRLLARLDYQQGGQSSGDEFFASPCLSPWNLGDVGLIRRFGVRFIQVLPPCIIVLISCSQTHWFWHVILPGQKSPGKKKPHDFSCKKMSGCIKRKNELFQLSLIHI